MSDKPIPGTCGSCKFYQYRGHGLFCINPISPFEGQVMGDTSGCASWREKGAIAPTLKPSEKVALAKRAMEDVQRLNAVLQMITESGLRADLRVDRFTTLATPFSVPVVSVEIYEILGLET